MKFFDKKIKQMLVNLTIPTIRVRYRIVHKDCCGNILSNNQYDSHSWVRNYYNALSGFCGINDDGAIYGAGNLNILDTGNTLRNGASLCTFFNSGAGGLPPYNLGGLIAAITVITNGIVVGTDATAESFEDYKLGAIIAHGNGGGQLMYSACSVVSQIYIPATLSWETLWRRTLTNSSGGAITINESGLYYYMQQSAAIRYAMTCRDVVVPVVMNNGDIVDYEYTIDMTFPG